MDDDLEFTIEPGDYKPFEPLLRISREELYKGFPEPTEEDMKKFRWRYCGEILR